jgi:hypothetical protein
MQKKILLFTWDYAQHSCTINHTFKVPFIPQNNDTKYTLYENTSFLLAVGI